METIECYVANLGKYNEGNYIGGWIKLPVEDQELDTFLKDTVKLDGVNYEEYAIHDYTGNNYNFGEYADIHDLNLVAKKLSVMNEQEIDTTKAYWNEILSKSEPMELLNLCYQVNDIPFCYYGFEGMEALSQTASNELKYAYTITEENGLQKQLEEMKIDMYFNYEQYGTEDKLAGAVVLSDNGYIYDNGCEIDLQFYSREELSEMVKDESKSLNKNAKEQAGKDSNLKSRIQTAKEKANKHIKGNEVKERGSR